MIGSLLKRTKFHRAALPLLAMLLTTTTAWAETETVTYIKADGTSGTQEAIILTGNENEIGSYNQTTWYVVKNTQEGVDVAYTNAKTLRGTVNIILEDGAEMTATSGSTTIWGVDGSTLNIYGQTNGTGRLSSESTANQAIAINGDINIYGGVISASATESNTRQAILANKASVNIYGGTVTATSSSGIAIRASTAVNIYGGAVTATGYQGISAGNITLGWTLPDDFIEVSNYDGNVTILPGKEFYYNNTEKVSSDDNISINDIKGKKLQPVVASIAIDGSNETIYSCLTEKESVFNRSDHDVNIKLLTDANFYGSQIIFDNNNSETEGETTQNTKITLDLNGHTITGDLTVESGCKLILIDSSNGKGHIKGAISVPVDALQNCLTNWSDKADVIKSTGYCGVSNENDGKNITWTLTKTDGDKIGDNFPLKLTISGSGAMADYILLSNRPWDNVCNLIAEAVISDDVTTIGEYAFQDCAITSITIPASVTSFRSAFCNCKKLANVIFKGNIKEISINAFYNCTALKEISLPNSVTNIGAGAFQGSGLTHITIPGSVSELPTGSISNCESLTDVTISEGVKIIYGAFHDCTALTEISIPSSVTNIYNNFIVGCSALKTVRINSTTTKCEYGAFWGCDALERIIVPNATTIAKYLEDKYFNYYNGDKICAEGYCGDENVNDGKNIKWSLMPIADEYINFGSEQNTDYKQAYALSITKNTDDENANLAMKDNSSSDNWYDESKYSLHERIKTVTIEEGITKIGTWAFSNCENLEIVAVPTTVTAIGEYAFNCCYKLVSVSIPKDVTSIDKWTFGNCYNLSSIEIPSTVTSIGYAAFYDCRSLTNIVIPSKVETIDKSAFSGCTALKTVRVMATTPPKIADYGDNGQYAPFSYCESLKYFFVPDVVAYSEAYGWKQDYILPLLRADKTTLFAQDASNTYMTWCDEFEWKKPKDCTVYTVSGVNSEQVQVAEVEGDVIPAYTPVLIKRAESELTADIKAELSAIVESVSANGTSYNEIDKDSRANQGTVIASYDGGCVYGNTGAVLNPKNVGWVVNGEYTSTYALYSDKFLMIDADEGIPTHRFIMRVFHKNDDARCARSLTIGVGGDTTGMEELKNEKIEELNSEWYDLQGRKLGSKPTRKGLYINNGKKIVIK